MGFNGPQRGLDFRDEDIDVVVAHEHRDMG